MVAVRRTADVFGAASGCMSGSFLQPLQMSVYILYIISVYRCDWIGIVSVEAVLMWMCYVSAYIRWQCAELTFNQEFRRRDLSG